MKELAYIEKIAVLRILFDIINADNVVHEKEVKYLKEIAYSLNLIGDYMQDVEELISFKAISIIKELSNEVKEEIAQIMGNMIVIDNDINYNEVKVYYKVCESCNMKKDFDVDGFPNCTISGPFVNPEDLIVYPNN